MPEEPFDVESYARRQRELAGEIERAQQRAGLPSPAADIDAHLSEEARVDVAKRLFTRALETDGLRTALYTLLRKSDYRYATLFRFDGQTNHAVVHVDRQQLQVELPTDFPIAQSYCQFVLDQKAPFLTIAASTDPATVGHPKREVFQAYCGLPICDPQGHVVGSICYYDEASRQPRQLDLELLLHAARAVEEGDLLKR
jgi:hypothetical protein